MGLSEVELVAGGMDGLKVLPGTTGCRQEATCLNQTKDGGSER